MAKPMNLEGKLQIIHKNFARVDEEEALRNVQHHQKVILKLVNAMKDRDEVFRIMFDSIYWTGSYYDDLIVDEPDEFDVCLLLNLPKVTFDVINDSSRYASAKIKIEDVSLLRDGHNWSKYKETLESWLGGEGYLKQDLFRQWFESLIVRTLSVNGIKKSGPAFTLEFDTYTIDVVPVIKVPIKQWPLPPVRQPGTLFSSRQNRLFLLSKPRDNQAPGDTDWLLDFHDQERDILFNRNFLKPTLRLLKLLRDREGWDDLKSFYIKNLFFWEVEKQDSTFWYKGMGPLFMHILGVLKDRLSEGRLPCFWDERHNLLKKMSTQRTEDMKNRLEYIIRKISDNVENVDGFFAPNED